MVTLTYGYSLWVLKQISDILLMITPKIGKTELMTVSSLPNVIRARPMIQCSYLDMPVLEGRLKYLEAIPVLDGRDEETQQQRNLKKSFLSDPSLPNVIKVPPLIQCTYQDPPVHDGRRKYLDTTSVLDGRDGETQQINSKKLLIKVTKCCKKLMYFLCNVIICTMCINTINISHTTA